MQVTFTKAAHAKDYPVWVAKVGRRVVRGSGLGSDPRRLPHDVVTLIVERELGITDGFFGTVAAGGTFRSMAKPRSTFGRTVIARNRPGLMAAEHAVNAEYQAWVRGGATTCRAALDRAHCEWMALPPGGQLALDWLPTPAHPARPKIRHRRR